MDMNAATLIKLTNTIYRCTQVYVDKKLEELNLSTGTYPYLLVLCHNEGISQNEISRELSVDKAMSARAIKHLIGLGYIKKTENQDDIRAYKLYLTPEGKAVVPQIRAIIQEWINILVDGSTNEEIEVSMKFLENVVKNGKVHRCKHCERRNNDEHIRK